MYGDIHDDAFWAVWREHLTDIDAACEAIRKAFGDRPEVAKRTREEIEAADGPLMRVR